MNSSVMDTEDKKKMNIILKILMNVKWEETQLLPVLAEYIVIIW